MSGETSFDADFELDFNPAPSPTDLRREKRVTGPPRALLGVVRFQNFRDVRCEGAALILRLPDHVLAPCAK